MTTVPAPRNHQAPQMTTTQQAASLIAMGMVHKPLACNTCLRCISLSLRGSRPVLSGYSIVLSCHVACHPRRQSEYTAMRAAVQRPVELRVHGVHRACGLVYRYAAVMVMPATVAAFVFLVGAAAATFIMMLWYKVGGASADTEPRSSGKCPVEHAPTESGGASGVPTADDGDSASSSDTELDYNLLTPDQVDTKALAAGLLKCDCSDVLGTINVVGISEVGDTSAAAASASSQAGLATKVAAPVDASDCDEDVDPAQLAQYQRIVCYLREFLAKPHPMVWQQHHRSMLRGRFSLTILSYSCAFVLVWSPSGWSAWACVSVCPSIAAPTLPVPLRHPHQRHVRSRYSSGRRQCYPGVCTASCACSTVQVCASVRESV